MRHRVAGRKLGRTSEHRLAMLRNMSTSLFERERIRTTLAKAKELRPFAEKLLTMSKRETLHARRQVLRHIKDPKVVSKLFDSLSARYAQRPGGYTRIIKLGPRRGDNAEMAIVELVGAEDVAAGAAEEKDQKTEKKGRKKAAKKEAAEAVKGEGKASAKKKTAKKTAKKKTVAKAAEPKAAKKAASKKTTAKKKTKAKSGDKG
jgi:large subunit ribosomal protein L17